MSVEDTCAHLFDSHVDHKKHETKGNQSEKCHGTQSHDDFSGDLVINDHGTVKKGKHPIKQGDKKVDS